MEHSDSQWSSGIIGGAYWILKIIETFLILSSKNHVIVLSQIYFAHHSWDILYQIAELVNFGDCLLFNALTDKILRQAILEDWSV